MEAMAVRNLSEPAEEQEPSAAAPVWLLTGNRPGEVSQQRALAEAIGVPFQEIQVATLAAAGGRARFDDSALHPPWPRLAISFGKTLPMALALRKLSKGVTRIVQLGRPRGVHRNEIDLIVPMPQDVMRDAPNVHRIRMPFNGVRRHARTDEVERRLLAAGFARPYSTLIIGGRTRQHAFAEHEITELADRIGERVRERGGSLLVSTSPRTSTETIASFRQRLRVPALIYEFVPDDRDNPLGAYMQLADELVVTGDSASMIAECWRSGRPLLVAPMRTSFRYRLVRRMRSLVPWLVERGQVPASVDIERWILQLERQGDVGVLGRSEPRRAYDAQRDDDLQRTAQRIRCLL
jgi:mitochondrial fission protein ELM1